MRKYISEVNRLEVYKVAGREDLDIDENPKYLLLEKANFHQ